MDIQSSWNNSRLNKSQLKSPNFNSVSVFCLNKSLFCLITMPYNKACMFVVKSNTIQCFLVQCLQKTIARSSNAQCLQLTFFQRAMSRISTKLLEYTIYSKHNSAIGQCQQYTHFWCWTISTLHFYTLNGSMYKIITQQACRVSYLI